MSSSTERLTKQAHTYFITGRERFFVCCDINSYRSDVATHSDLEAVN